MEQMYKLKAIKDQTALHTFVQQYNPDREVIKYLIIKGVGVNDPDNDGNTPLHLCKWKEFMDCLVEMGADIRAQYKKTQTPAQMNPDLWKCSTSHSDTEDETDSD